MNRDPIGEQDGPNLLAFLFNSPVTFFDVLGLMQNRYCYSIGQKLFGAETPCGGGQCYENVNIGDIDRNLSGTIPRWAQDVINEFANISWNPSGTPGFDMFQILPVLLSGKVEAIQKTYSEIQRFEYVCRCSSGGRARWKKTGKREYKYEVVSRRPYSERMDKLGFSFSISPWSIPEIYEWFEGRNLDNESKASDALSRSLSGIAKRLERQKCPAFGVWNKN